MTRLKIFEHEGKDQEKLKALIAANNPAQAVKTRADMEKAEQAEGAKLKAADAFEREKSAKVVATMRAIGDRYQTPAYSAASNAVSLASHASYSACV
jgi:hypothetical protein